MNQELLKHFLPPNEGERRNLAYFAEHGEYPIERFNVKQYEQKEDNCSLRSKKAHNDPAKLFLLDGILISGARHYRFERSQEHTHDFVEIVYMFSGQTTHLVDGNELVLRTGEILFINQHASHENPLPALEEDIAVNFMVTPPFFEKILSMIGSSDNALYQFLVDCMRNKKREGVYLHFKVANVPVVQNLLENLVWFVACQVPYRTNVTQQTMGLLFMYLLNHTDKAHSGSKRDDLTIKILQYVDEKYADGSLDALAKLLSYDVKWLSTSIKQLTGSTFTQLQQTKRISQAKYLLETTELPVKEIARRVGYCDASHFHSLFQRQTACSPKCYRDTLRVCLREEMKPNEA